MPTHVYLMTQQLCYSHKRAYNENEDALWKTELCECDHMDDTVFTFGIPLCEAELTLRVKFSDDERKLSKLWMEYLDNFARTG